MNTIRLDARATDIFEDVAEKVDLETRMRVMQEVRNADRVIDAQDRIIKDRNTLTPRAATFADIEQSRLVRG